MLAAGCTTRLVYDNADFLLSNFVENYVPLDSRQAGELDWRVAALMTWHRDTELPHYVDWLDRVADAVGSRRALGDDEVAGWAGELAAFWGRVGRQAAPDLVALGGSLDDGQVEALVARLREDQAERRAEYGDRTAAEAREQRARSMERFLKRWTGRLSRPQQALVEAWADRLEPTTVQWLASREAWVAELEAALAQRADPAALEAAVERLFVEPSTRWDPAYRAAIERNTATTARFLAELVNDLDARQRARAAERIDDLARTLEALAADP